MTKSILSLVILCGTSISIVHAQETYTITGLSKSDLITIGAGLGKLPREETDEQHGNLWVRIQQQIFAQGAAASKVQADAQKAAMDKAVADALAAAKEAAKSPETKATEP